MPQQPLETRTVDAQFEMRDDATSGAPILEGYAATFNQEYDLGSFREQIHPDAFKRTLTNSPDVRLLVDHEGQPLARTKSGTLQLSTDSTGLHARAMLDPSDPDVQRLLPKMRRGDLDQMSFAFRVPAGGDSWSKDFTQRTIREASLAGGDVSVVTYPANDTTSVSVRSNDVHAARAVLADALFAELRNGQTLSPGNFAKLRRSIDVLSAEQRGLTANDTRSSLDEAISEAYGGRGSFACVIDFDDTNVYFTVYSYSDAGEDDDTFRQAYTLAADGMTTLVGTRTQVRARTNWVPVNDPDDASDLADSAVTRGRPLDVMRRRALLLTL